MARARPNMIEQPVTNGAEATGEVPDNTQIIGGHLTREQHQMLYERMRRGLARRLYEVWCTAGQLSGEKWDWHNQSTRSQQAWVAVARAVMGPALQEQFGVAEIASLVHG
jgi:hypothetical protein